MLHAALHTISFVTRLLGGQMRSDWFNGMEILQGRWRHGEKVEYCYSSGLEKTLCKWDIYTGCHRRKGQNFGRVFLMLNYTEKLQTPKHTYPKLNGLEDNGQ
jgi:hypothetical protein